MRPSFLSPGHSFLPLPQQFLKMPAPSTWGEWPMELPSKLGRGRPGPATRADNLASELRPQLEARPIGKS